MGVPPVNLCPHRRPWTGEPSGAITHGSTQRTPRSLRALFSVAEFAGGQRFAREVHKAGPRLIPSVAHLPRAHDDQFQRGDQAILSANLGAVIVAGLQTFARE